MGNVYEGVRGSVRDSVVAKVRESVTGRVCVCVCVCGGGGGSEEPFRVRRRVSDAWCPENELNSCSSQQNILVTH